MSYNSASAQRHQPSRFELHPFLGERMLDALVLADRAAEHRPLARIGGGASQSVLPDADRLRRDQDALGVEAVQDGCETATLLADRGRLPARTSHR